MDYEKLMMLLRASLVQQMKHREVDPIFLCDDNLKSRG